MHDAQRAYVIVLPLLSQRTTDDPIDKHIRGAAKYTREPRPAGVRNASMESLCPSFNGQVREKHGDPNGIPTESSGATVTALPHHGGNVDGR